MRLASLSLAASALVAAAAIAGPSDSVVKVTASVRYPNPIRPWTRGNTVEVIGTGVVIEGKRVLTCAHLVHYAAEVTVQSRPGGDKFTAKVETIGTDVDLAVLSVSDDAFFQKFPPLRRSKGLPNVQDNVAVYGFSIGGNDLAVTKGVVSRIDVGAYEPGGYGLYLQVSAAMNPGNSGGPAVVDSAMVGLAVSRLDPAENIGFIVPNEEIDFFLRNIRDGRYQPKPVEAAGTGFQRLENEALRHMLGVDAKTKGIVACPPQVPPPGYSLKPFDVVVRIGDHEIDSEGMIRLEGGQRVPFTYMIPRLAHGEGVPLSVLRSGKRLAVELPVTRIDHRLVREFQGEQPSYFVFGPLVFSPLKADAISMYARLNPGVYGINQTLFTRRFDRTRFPGEELVVVTTPMFRHKISKGYDEPVGQIVREVNGTKVRNLQHLVATLRDCKDEYLTLRFGDEPSSVMVLERKAVEPATEEIMEENGIAPTRRGSPEVMKVWKGDTAAK
jgi:S1-C subfamily serine protease